MQHGFDASAPAQDRAGAPPSRFVGHDIHSVFRQPGVAPRTSSAGLGWSHIFASIQREEPFQARFATGDCALLVTGMAGPVDVRYRIGRRQVSRHIQEKAVFFLPPHRDCEVILDTPLDSIHVYLRPELFGEHVDGSRSRDLDLSPLLGEAEPIVGGLLAVIEEMLNEPDPGAGLLADSVSRAIANRLRALNGAELPAEARHRPESQLGNRLIRSIREFIEANLANRIRLAELAAICGMSEEHFIRMFKSSLGVSPHRYVIGLRIAHAKRLLSDTSTSLDEIACRCGFAHQSHFANSFRRMAGVSPGAYRRAAVNR